MNQYSTSFTLIASLTLAAQAGAAPSDFNGDGLSDIAYRQAENSQFSVLASAGDGEWFEELRDGGELIGQAGVITLVGDFDGDKISDVALYFPGGGWEIVPVFLGREGGWELEQRQAPTWANASDARALVGDFDGDGRDDIGVYGPGTEEKFIRILRGGDSKWIAEEHPVESSANQEDVAALVGDFNGDGRADIALHRPGTDEKTIPVLSRQGDGTFVRTNIGALPVWANDYGVRAVVGDYDGDSASDLALYRPASTWVSVPLLRSRDGEWVTTVIGTSALVSAPGTIAVAADFNGDKRTDLVFHLPNGHDQKLSILLPTADGSWEAQEQAVPSLVNRPGVVLVVGDYNGDDRLDLSFSRPDGESSEIVTLLGDGLGGWDVRSGEAPAWAYELGVNAVARDRGREIVAYSSELIDSGDPSYDVTEEEASEWQEAIEGWLNFLRVFVRIVLGYQEFVERSGLNGQYDGIVYAGNQRAQAFLELEQRAGEVRGRLIILESTIRLNGGACTDYTVPVSVLPVRAQTNGLYQASGQTSRNVASIGPFSGTADVDFDFSIETTFYELMTGTIAIDVPWPCRNQNLSVRFTRRPL